MRLSLKRPRIFYGWYVVAACILIVLYTNGVVSLGFTAVFEPIAQEFGWSYAQISLGSSLRGLEIGLLAPVLGIMVTRWGPRRLVMAGSLFTCCGFMVLTRVTSLSMFYLAFALISVGMSTFSQTVLMTAVTNWFRMRAGVAIGIAASGFGLGGLMVPLLTRMIDTLQWRNAMFVVGIGVLVIVLPLSLIIRREPKQTDSAASSTSGEAVSVAAPVPKTAELNVSASQAVRDRAFWHLAVASMCHSATIAAVITHVMPYLGTVGISRSAASLVALVLPLVSIGGRVSSAWLGGRFGNKYVFMASFISMTAGLLMFRSVTVETAWLVVPFVICFSLGWGCSVTSRFHLLRDYFGITSFGTILGFLSGIMMLGNMSGAPLAGWIYDTASSYHSAWLLFSCFTVTGALLVFTIPSARRAPVPLSGRQTSA